jgi:hypothetical protein
MDGQNAVELGATNTVAISLRVTSCTVKNGRRLHTNCVTPLDGQLGRNSKYQDGMK